MFWPESGETEEDGEFQSTLPSRGATPLQSKQMCCIMNFNPRSPHGERLTGACRTRSSGIISIHAPLTGSDSHAARHGTAGSLYFNPRSPHGERLLLLLVLLLGGISIHAPLTGSDRGQLFVKDDFCISIHAPLTGSDNARRFASDRRSYFNPRSPHGERLTSGAGYVYQWVNFNPRSPHGERPSRTGAAKHR